MLSLLLQLAFAQTSLEVWVLPAFIIQHPSFLSCDLIISQLMHAIGHEYVFWSIDPIQMLGKLKLDRHLVDELIHYFTL